MTSQDQARAGEVDVTRQLLSCTLFVGLGTAMVVAVLLAVLPSVRIAGGADATDASLAVRAVLVDGAGRGPVPAAPEAWRRCPYLAAIAAGSGCPYLEGLRRGAGRCPALPPSVEPAPPPHPPGAVSAQLAPAGPLAPVVPSAHPA